MKTIYIKDFTEYPGLRYCSMSDKSGEEYYHVILNGAFASTVRDGGTLQVNLDDTEGYASSFLDEAFGNLVYDFTLDLVSKHISIVSSIEPHWKKMIEEETFIEWEKRRIDKKQPKITKKHPEWTKYVDGKLRLGSWLKVDDEDI